MKNFNKAREENKEKNGELTDKEEKEFIEMLSGKDESKWNNILKINNFFRGKEKPKTEEDKKLVETAKRFIDKYGEPLNTIEYSAAIWNGLKVLPDKSDNMSFYGRMLQQFLNRQRRSTESGEKVDIPVKPGKKSDPPDDYIGYVAYFAQKYNQGLDRS